MIRINHGDWNQHQRMDELNGESGTLRMPLEFTLRQLVVKMIKLWRLNAPYRVAASI